MSTLMDIQAAADALPREQRQVLVQHILETLTLSSEHLAQNMHELMKDGCGIVDSGVTDLASNKEHLLGYGR